MPHQESYWSGQWWKRYQPYQGESGLWAAPSVGYQPSALKYTLWEPVWFEHPSRITRIPRRWAWTQSSRKSRSVPSMGSIFV